MFKSNSCSAEIFDYVVFQLIQFSTAKSRMSILFYTVFSVYSCSHFTETGKNHNYCKKFSRLFTFSQMISSNSSELSFLVSQMESSNCSKLSFPFSQMESSNCSGLYLKWNICRMLLTTNYISNVSKSSIIPSSAFLPFFEFSR